MEAGWAGALLRGGAGCFLAEGAPDAAGAAESAGSPGILEAPRAEGPVFGMISVASDGLISDEAATLSGPGASDRVAKT